MASDRSEQPFEQLISLAKKLPDLFCGVTVDLRVDPIDLTIPLKAEDIKSVQLTSAPSGERGIMIEYDTGWTGITRCVVTETDFHFEPDPDSVEWAEILGLSENDKKPVIKIRDMPEVIPYTHITRFIANAEEAVTGNDLDRAFAAVFVVEAIFKGLARFMIHAEESQYSRRKQLRESIRKM